MLHWFRAVRRFHPFHAKAVTSGTSCFSEDPDIADKTCQRMPMRTLPAASRKVRSRGGEMAKDHRQNSKGVRMNRALPISMASLLIGACLAFGQSPREA